MSLDVSLGDIVRAGDMIHCNVRIDGHSYDVSVSSGDAEILAPGADLADLIGESFRFLLEREPPDSILSRFDLTVIGDYFPEYRRDIASRLLH